MSSSSPVSMEKMASGDPYTIVACFAALSVLYFTFAKVYDVYFGPLSKYPGPKSHAFSILPAIRTKITGHDNTDYPALHARYGPIVRTGPKQISYANGAMGFKDIYGFRKSGQRGMYKSPWFYIKPVNGVDSIITADDANHSRQRKILSHAFSDRALREQEPLLKNWIELLIEKLQILADSGGKADMVKYYNCTTFDIMGDLTFAESLDMLEESEYSPWLKTVFDSMKDSTFFRGIKAYNAVSSYFVENVLFKTEKVRQKSFEHWNYSKERVDRRLARQNDRPDLWTKILEKSDGPEALSLGEHHSTAAFFMLAGTETTATALSGTTYHLLQNPDKLAKLTSELRSSFKSFEDLSLEYLARQKYLMAVLQEGLRMYPPVPSDLPRTTPKGGAAICGEWVPEGVTVGVHHLSTYRNEDLFRKANEFHPERWLGDPEFKDDHLDALEPFSVGPRNCLGKNLAWHEMRLLLAGVLVHFDLKLCDESKSWRDQKVFTLWEKKPLMCTLTPAKA